LACAALSAMCGGKPDPNAQPNMNPIYTNPPVLVSSIENAHLYTVGEGDDLFTLLHLYGTPYEMGFAQGTIMKTQVTAFFLDVKQYVLDQVEEALNGSVPWFPAKLAAEISELGLDAVLDLEVDATIKFTGDYFIQEIQGLSDATGVNFKDIQRLHLLGELTKGDCSMFGAWGDALADGYSLIQLRALDWDMDGPFRNYPQVTVYHPNQGNGQPFANVGFSGFVGSFSGMSSVQMATSEIGVDFPDSTFGKESRIGVPFTYLLRDVLQFDASLSAAETHITDANRTCYLILGVGDGKEGGGFRGIEYSYSVANFYNDQNMMPIASWHPRIDNIVYYGMDWLCPGYNQVLANQLTYAYGKITPQLAIQNITAIEQSGNLFLTYYDLGNNVMYMSFAASHNETVGSPNAFDRTFAQINMADVWNVAAPTAEDIRAAAAASIARETLLQAPESTIPVQHELQSIIALIATE